jgi:hypothetical protein
MKFIFIILLVVFKAWSMDCQVDGISDSPQKLNCYIQNRLHVDKLDLVCNDLTYVLKWNEEDFPVYSAYHEEVESGSTPLVFIARDTKLTIVSYRFYSRAYMENDDQNYFGLCFNR